MLMWILESGSGEVLLVPVGNAPEDVFIVPGGPRRTGLGSDFRELAAQGLLRHVKEQLYEVTNLGRIACEQLVNPPPAPPPVGFQP